MLQKKYKWFKIAESITELPFGKNNIAEIEVAGKKICIIQKAYGLAGCAAKCPHAGGDMCEGFLDKNENIVCPIHRYVFSLANGRDITREGFFLKIYPVMQNTDGVFVGIQEGGLFSWLK